MENHVMEETRLMETISESIRADVPARFADLHTTVDRALQKRVLEGR